MPGPNGRIVKVNQPANLFGKIDETHDRTMKPQRWQPMSPTEISPRFPREGWSAPSADDGLPRQHDPGRRDAESTPSLLEHALKAAGGWTGKGEGHRFGDKQDRTPRSPLLPQRSARATRRDSTNTHAGLSRDRKRDRGAGRRSPSGWSAPPARWDDRRSWRGYEVCCGRANELDQTRICARLSTQHRGPRNIWRGRRGGQDVFGLSEGPDHPPHSGRSKPGRGIACQFLVQRAPGNKRYPGRSCRVMNGVSSYLGAATDLSVRANPSRANARALPGRIQNDDAHFP